MEKINSVYIPIVPKHLRRVLRGIENSTVNIKASEYVRVCRLVEKGWERDEALYTVGKAAAIMEVMEAIDRDCEQQVESRKKQLLHQLEDLGMRFDLEGYSQDFDSVTTMDVENWPVDREGQRYEV